MNPKGHPGHYGQNNQGIDEVGKIFSDEENNLLAINFHTETLKVYMLRSLVQPQLQSLQLWDLSAGMPKNFNFFNHLFGARHHHRLGRGQRGMARTRLLPTAQRPAGCPGINRYS